jgi:hypothetical protein
MDLPGLKESLEEMKRIGGIEMEKPKSASITQVEVFNPIDRQFHKEKMTDGLNPDFILRRDFAAQIVSLQEKFLRVVEENDDLREENDDLRAENQRLRTERIKILEIMGGR